MKTTEKFDQDFRPDSRSKNERECLDPLTFPNYRDLLFKVRRIGTRFGLSIAIQ